MADLGVLGAIAARAIERIAREKTRRSVESLRAEPLYGRSPMSLAKALSFPGPRVIAEVKFTSPSEGVLRPNPSSSEASEIAASYVSAGAAAISIITEPEFFAGDAAFLAAARRKCSNVPLLMKDFFVDEYQFEIARSVGADAILLIAALLGPRLSEMHQSARFLGLSVLVEVHDEKEALAAIAAGADIIGVNSRDLRTLRVDLSTARRLAPLVCRSGITAVAESGLNSRADIDSLFSLGYSGFLIGSSLMRTPEPGAALKMLLV